jgi:hypothetical protein
MKKVSLLLVIITAFAGCKKNDSAPKQFLLAKVIMNGQLQDEYIYDNKMQLIEEKSHNDVNGTLISYRHQYVYDANGKLKEMSSYKLPATKPYGKWVYKLDAAGRVTRMSTYSLSGADSGKLSTHIDNEYNANNRVAQQVWRDENEEQTSIRKMAYYPNGNMRAVEGSMIFNQVANKFYTTNYGPSDTTLPASFYQVTAFPVNFYYNVLLSPYTTTYLYDNGQVKEERKEIMSARKYNAQGLVVQQTITTKKIKPVGPDEVRMMQYEYKAY